MYCLDWAGPKPVPSGVRGTVGVDNQQADVFPNTVDFNYQKEESIIWARSTVMVTLCAAVVGLCPTKPTQAQNAGTTGVVYSLQTERSGNSFRRRGGSGIHDNCSGIRATDVGPDSKEWPLALPVTPANPNWIRRFCWVPWGYRVSEGHSLRC